MKDKKIKYNLSYFIKNGGRGKKIYNSPPLPGEENGIEANLSNLNTVIEGELNQNNLSNNGNNGHNGHNGNGQNGNIGNNRRNVNLAVSSPNQINNRESESLAAQIEQAEREQAEREQAAIEQALREQQQREQTEQAERNKAEKERVEKENMKKQEKQQKGEFASQVSASQVSAFMNQFNSAPKKKKKLKTSDLEHLDKKQAPVVTSMLQSKFNHQHAKSKNLKLKEARAEAESANTGTKVGNVLLVSGTYQTPNQLARSKTKSKSASSANAISNSMKMFLSTVSILRENPEIAKQLKSAIKGLGARYAKGQSLQKYVDRIRELFQQLKSKTHRQAMKALTDEELTEFILQSLVRTVDPDINAIRASSLERLALAQEALATAEDMAKQSNNRQVINQLQEAQQEVQIANQIANQVNNLSAQIQESQVQLQESQESLRSLVKQEQQVLKQKDVPVSISEFPEISEIERARKIREEKYLAQKAIRNAEEALRKKTLELQETALVLQPVSPPSDDIEPKIMYMVNTKPKEAKEEEKIVYVGTKGKVQSGPNKGYSGKASSSSAFNASAARFSAKENKFLPSLPSSFLPRLTLPKKERKNQKDQKESGQQSFKNQLAERAKSLQENFVKQRKKILEETLKSEYGNDQKSRNRFQALFPGAVISKEPRRNVFGDVIEASEAPVGPAAKFLKSVEDETNGDYAELKTHGDRLIYYNKLKKLYPNLSNEKRMEKNMKRKKAYERQTGQKVSLLDDTYAGINDEVLALAGIGRSNADSRKAAFDLQSEKEKMDRQKQLDNGKQAAEAAKAAEERNKLQKMHDNEVKRYQTMYRGLSEAEKPAFHKELAEMKFLFDKLKNKYPGLTPKQKRDYYKELQESYPLLSNIERENIDADLKTRYPYLNTVLSRKNRKSRNNRTNALVAEEEEEEEEQQAMRRAPPRMSFQNAAVQNAAVQNAAVQNAAVQNAAVNNGFTLVQRKQRNKRILASIPPVFENIIKKILKIEMLDKTTEEKTKYRLPLIREYIHESDYSIEQLEELIDIISELEIPINVKKRYLRELDKKIKENLKAMPKPNKSGQTFSELLLKTTSNTSRKVNKSKSFANVLKPKQNKAKPLPKSSTKSSTKKNQLSDLSDLSEFTRVPTFNETQILKQIRKLPNPKIKIKDIKLQIASIGNKTIQKSLKKKLANKLTLITKK
jgi:hypothetical protein